MEYLVLDDLNLSSEEFDGEMVAVNFSTGKYYGMKGSAEFIWRLFETPRLVDEIIARVRDAHDGFSQDDELLVRDFVARLKSEGVLKAASAPADTANGHAAPAARGAFTPPSLEIHSDLQELILLDPVHDADPEHGWPLRRADDGA